MSLAPASGDAASPLRVVAHNVVHLRAKPMSGAEMVSQQLLGRTVRILKEEGGWAWIEGDDAYRGWAEVRWLAEPKTDRVYTPVTTVFAELRAAPAHHAPLVMRLSIECGVHVDGPMSDTPFLHLEASGGGQQQGQQFAVRERWLQVSLPDGRTTGWLPANAVGRREAMPLTAFRGRAKKMPPEQAARVPSAAVQYGRAFLGTPYLWGGSSSFGLDCSGFVQLAYRLAGVTLRRDADIQRSDERFLPVEVKEVAKGGDDLQPGDLVFFGKPDKITHVGMHLEGNRFIHSAGGAGVIISEWGDERYSPGFVDARRLNPDRAGAGVTRFEAEDR